MTQSMRENFRHFARNERWGDCVACPRDSEGNSYPEFCPFTQRGDHQQTLAELVTSYHNYRRAEWSRTPAGRAAVREVLDEEV